MENARVLQSKLGLEIPERTVVPKVARSAKKRANELDGTTWTKYSISIWNDIRKSPEEQALGHPAIFPTALVMRLIKCFTTADDEVVLDPFVGIGSTAIAAEALGKTGIGIELSAEFADKARKRPPLPRAMEGMNQEIEGAELGQRIIYTADANDLSKYVAPNSVDFVVTSPPYWDILLQERTADGKEIRHYGPAERDLGKIRDYTAFINALGGIFSRVFEALKPGKYCCVVVMDIRKKNKFYPLHADLASVMQGIGFIFDDLIIWDRRHEYNYMRPLGYPYKFRINKAHEYILIFQKPAKER